MIKDKKTIILVVIVGVLLLITIILAIIKSNPDTTAKRLDDSKTFFIINNLINQTEIQTTSMAKFYTSTAIYYKEYDIYKAYFVTGFITDNDIETKYTNNVNYLIKTKGPSFELLKLNDENIVTYANKFNASDIKFESNRIIPSYNYNEKNKLIYYIMAFYNILNNNPENAYNYLSESKKTSYNGVSDFKSKAPEILVNLSSYIKDYTKEETKEGIIYNISTKANNIKINENGVMNFTIEY